ncbi:ATP-dependent DNA ligase [Candidatus Marsarchaeota archaeon]|nr:ATP-dependent DNA ligase [Candidatus Marsarchaeota archaeon]MCL5404408.1 ATP-dependent DNA ligase [Candidatus Marsarchaeota archaeon]
MLFSELASYYERLEGISSRLEMIEVMSSIFKSSTKDEIDKIVYMTQGVLAPPFEGIEFGVAEKMAEEAIAIASGFSKQEVENSFRKLGDLGSAAEKLVGESKLKRMSSSKLSVTEVYGAMFKIAQASGKGSKDQKIRMLASMIAQASPIEARYIVRYPLGQLRLGLGDATMLEALSVMESGERKLKEDLERAYNICSDLGVVAKELKSNGIKAIKSLSVTLFKPIRPALAERLPTVEKILEKMGGKCAAEQKYDGFRCQIHKDGKRVKIYSRRLEETTSMFPDLVTAVQHEIKAEKAIFEGEALAFNDVTNEFMPFQETIQRKRKHGISEKSEELPLKLMAFDLLYLEGKDYMGEPYSARRAKLESLTSNGNVIGTSNRIVTSSAKELEKFFESSIENGLEGIVAKDLNAQYIAGARKFSWIKLKRSYKGELSDTLDLVIIGYYRGKGSRTQFGFGGLLCAVYNDKTDMFESVSKIGTGFTEKQMQELSETLEKIRVQSKPARVSAIIEPDFWVYPKYVITVRADEITKSPTHTCGMSKDENGIETGYALRFPRLAGDEAIRSDKGPADATTTKEIIELFKQQKKVRVPE